MEDTQLRSLVEALLKVEPGERLSDMASLKAHPFFGQHVDWEDVGEFMEMGGEGHSEEEKDLLDFFGHRYNLGFYGEDIEQIDHYTFGSLLADSGEAQGEDMHKLDTFTL